MNIIPINYFIDGMLEIANDPQNIGKRFHFVNDESVNVREFFDGLCQGLQVETPRFYSSSEVSQEDTSPFRHFQQYFQNSYRFDNQMTKNILVQKNIVCTPISSEYLQKNAEYFQKIQSN